jgi:hypothetical protein
MLLSQAAKVLTDELDGADDLAELPVAHDTG